MARDPNVKLNWLKKFWAVLSVAILFVWSFLVPSWHRITFIRIFIYKNSSFFVIFKPWSYSIKYFMCIFTVILECGLGTKSHISWASSQNSVFKIQFQKIYYWKTRIVDIQKHVIWTKYQTLKFRKINYNFYKIFFFRNWDSSSNIWYIINVAKLNCIAFF